MRKKIRRKRGKKRRGIEMKRKISKKKRKGASERN